MRAMLYWLVCIGMAIYCVFDKRPSEANVWVAASMVIAGLEK